MSPKWSFKSVKHSKVSVTSSIEWNLVMGAGQDNQAGPDHHPMAINIGESIVIDSL